MKKMQTVEEVARFRLDQTSGVAARGATDSSFPTGNGQLSLPFSTPRRFTNAANHACDILWSSIGQSSNGGNGTGKVMHRSNLQEAHSLSITACEA